MVNADRTPSPPAHLVALFQPGRRASSSSLLENTRTERPDRPSGLAVRLEQWEHRSVFLEGAGRRGKQENWKFKVRHKKGGSSPFSIRPPPWTATASAFSSREFYWLERFRGGPEFPAENPAGRQPIERESACSPFSWTPTIADFSIPAWNMRHRCCSRLPEFQLI